MSDVREKLNERQRQAYETLKNGGPMTGQELSEAAGVPGLWKRISELKKLALVVSQGKSRCTVTGKNSVSWSAVTEGDFT